MDEKSGGWEVVDGEEGGGVVEGGNGVSLCWCRLGVSQLSRWRSRDISLGDGALAPRRSSLQGGSSGAGGCMLTWGSDGVGVKRSGEAVLLSITVPSSPLKNDVTASPASDRIEVMDENREVWLSILVY